MACETREKWTLHVSRAVGAPVTNQPTFENITNKIGVFATKFELAGLLENIKVNRPKTTVYVMRGEHSDAVWENKNNYAGGSVEILAQLEPPNAVLRTLADSFVFEGQLDAGKPDRMDDLSARQPRVNGFHVKPYQRENLTGVRVVIWIDDVRSAMFKDLNKMPLVRDLKRLFVKDFGKEFDAAQFTPHFNRSAFDFGAVEKLGCNDELMRVRAEYEAAGYKVGHRVDGERKRPRSDLEPKKAGMTGRGQSSKSDNRKASSAADAPPTNGSASDGIGTSSVASVEGHGGGVQPSASAGRAKPAVNGDNHLGFERGRFVPSPSTQQDHARGRENSVGCDAPRLNFGKMSIRQTDNTTKRGDDWVANNKTRSDKPVDDAELLGDYKTRETVQNGAANPVVIPAPTTDGGGAFGFASITSAKPRSIENSIGSGNCGVGRGKPQIASASSPHAVGRGSSAGGDGGAGRGLQLVAAVGLESACSTTSGGIGCGAGRGRGKRDVA